MPLRVGRGIAGRVVGRVAAERSERFPGIPKSRRTCHSDFCRRTETGTSRRSRRNCNGYL